MYLRLVGDVHGYTKDYINLVEKATFSIQLGDMGFDYEELYDLDPYSHVFIGGNHDNYTMKPLPDLEPWVPALSDSIVSPRLRSVAIGTIISPNENFHLTDGLRTIPYVQSLLPSVERETVYEFTEFPTHYLGNYGRWTLPNTEKSIFFIRGGWSIDQKYRFVHKWPWWPREQMSMFEMESALHYYVGKKPDFVVSHEAPLSVLMKVGLNAGKVIPTATNRLLDYMYKEHQPKYWVFAHYHQYINVKMGETHFIGLNMLGKDNHFVDFDKDLNLE